jgi:hypothetical protein
VEKKQVRDSLETTEVHIAKLGKLNKTTNVISFFGFKLSRLKSFFKLQNVIKQYAK